MVEYKPLSNKEHAELWQALRSNVEEGKAILTNRFDTSFAGVADGVPDEDVVQAIKSCHTHY